MSALAPTIAPHRPPFGFNFGNFAPEADRTVAEAPSGPRPCPTCRGRKTDRYGFDCTTCVGEGTVDE